MKDIGSIEMIEQRIFVIRGQRVMIDRDLARLYGVKTKALKQAVKRNIERFPKDFMFQLTWEETKALRSQIVTLKQGSIRGMHSKYRAYAFTEQGVAMLSSVLKSKRAIQVNIHIMRAFVKLRRIVMTHHHFAMKLDELEKKYDAQFKIVFDAIKQLMIPPEKSRRRIGFHKE